MGLIKRKLRTSALQTLCCIVTANSSFYCITIANTSRVFSVIFYSYLFFYLPWLQLFFHFRKVDGFKRGTLSFPYSYNHALQYKY